MRAEVANRRAAPVIGAAVAVLGLLVLGAWAFDVPILQSLNPQWVTMKANTALSFVLAGSALWLLGAADRSARRRVAGTLAAMAMGMIGLLTALAYALGLDLGLDQLLFSDPGTPIPRHPGRPAPMTALLFVLVAISLLLLRAAGPVLVMLADVSIGLVAASAYLAIIGYFYGAPGLYTVPGYSSMALHTAVGFVLLGVGLFLARPDRGVMRFITAPRAAGATARRLLPVAILAPVLLGYAELHAFESLGLSPAAADLLIIVSFIAIFAGTILWSAAAVDRVDAQRQRLEISVRLAEQQAKDELRWRNFLESAPDASVIVDAEGCIVFVNGRAEEIFGYAREEMLRQSVEMLVPERLRAAHAGHRAAYLCATRIRPMRDGGTLYGRRKNGSEFPIDVSLAPVGTDDGVLVAAAIRDSTARLQREAALLEARAEAEAASSRLQALIEAVPLAVVELDQDGRICSWNPATERMSGWRAEEVIGQKPPTVPSDRTAEIDFMLAGSNAAPLQGFETRRMRKDGKLVDIAVWTAPRRDSGGAVVGTIAIAADITEQKKLEEHFRQSQRLQAVGQLTGGIAHEFNNLLQVLLGNLDLLRNSVRYDAPAEKMIETLMRTVKRGAELTHQLLAFSRKQPLRPRAFSPGDELRAMEKLIRASIGAQYALRFEAAADVSAAVADTTQLDNAILNLVINARDAMPGGGSVLLRAQDVLIDAQRAHDLDIRPGPYVALEVTDTGTGMTPEVQARAIEPFFTTKEVGKGTGLGLSMVDGFAKQSGGALEIISAPGKGTTVRLLLPIATAAAEPDAAPPRPRLVGARNVTVLVVEDDPEVLLAAAATLRGLGYTVIEAADGPSALAALKQAGRVDVLFTDVVLPKGMSGRDLADIARAHRPNIAVIYTSGYNENVIVHDNKLDPGILLVRKPYSKDDLYAAISAATQSGVGSSEGRWGKV